MTKKSLQNWYNSSDITYSEKERLNKIGVSDYDYHCLQDLKQMLRCENWSSSSSEIRNKLSGKRIKKITFFTPNFNDSKPDASNYSCGIVTDGSDNVWAVVYRPSHTGEIGNDVVVKKTNISASEAERKLNGNYPVVAISPKVDVSLLIEVMKWPYLYERNLSSDAKYNPDKYILPLDIVKRPINSSFDHYAIYLGNRWVAHLPGGGKPTQFDSWKEFHSPSGRGSSSFSWSFSSSSSSSSSSSNSGSGEITLYHPQIPFKRKEDIIRHVAKAISYGYGRSSYDKKTNNCEHIVRRCVLGLDISPQSVSCSGLPTKPLDLIMPVGPLSSFSKAWDGIMDKSTLEKRITLESDKLDGLISSYSYEKNRIEQYIQEVENNRSYTRSKYQIEQEKFQERIEVYPKDWCRIS